MLASHIAETIFRGQVRVMLFPNQFRWSQRNDRIIN